MRVPLSVFIQFCILMMSGYIWFYKVASEYFSDEKYAKIELKKIEKRIEQKEFEKQVITSQLENFKFQTMALLDKDDSVKKTSIVYQNLKSSLRSPASIAPIDMSDLSIEEMKSAFREKKYSKAISIGEKIAGEKKVLLVKPEVLFFLCESYFLSNQFEKAVDKINQLVSAYPEHLMTGYSLIRLAQISEKADQVNEAEAIYKVIVGQFQDKALKSEAEKALKAINE